jgi:hypothetical protein
VLGLGINIAYPNVSGEPTAYVNSHSLSLDGTGDYFDTNYQTDATFRDSFSLSMWIKLDDGRPSSTTELFGSQIPGNIFSLALGGAGNLAITHFSNFDVELVMTTSDLFPDGAMSDFVHVVVVVTKDSGSGNTTYAVYFDGAVISSAAFFGLTAANHALFTTTNDFYIGGSNGSSYASMPGLIDDTSLWSKALSAGEVSAIYNSGVPTDLTGSSDLVLYYRFDNNTNDSTGTSNGTLGGDATYSTTTP